MASDGVSPPISNPQIRLGRRWRQGSIGLLVAGLALLLYARFNAVNAVIMPFLQRAVHPELYGLDSYITHSVVPRSTFAFEWLAWFHLDLTQPGFLVPTYGLVTAMCAAALWRILGKSFAVNDPLIRVALMFALAFADFKLIGFNKSSWMLEHNFSFTFLAAALRFWFLAFLLEQRVVAMTALLIPINILSVKVGWPLVGFAALAMIGLRCWSPWAWGLLAISLILPGWAAVQDATHLDPAGNAYVFAAINQFHAAEDNPFAGPAWQTPIFLVGIAFGLWRLRGLSARLIVPIGAVLIGSLLVWAIGGIYLTWGWQIRPIPLAILLSPARAMELAALLIYLLVLLWILERPRLGGVDRALFILSVLLLKITDDAKWIKLAIALAVLGLLWAGLRRLLAQRGIALPRWLDALPAPVILAGLAVPIGLFFALNLAGQRTSYRLDPVLGFRDAAIPADALPMLRQIATERGDRRILFVTRGKDWQIAEWNMLVRKSGLVNDPYYLALPAEIERQQMANQNGDLIVAGLRQGLVNPEAARYMLQQDVSLIAPLTAQAALPGWEVLHEYGVWRELRPPQAAEHSEIGK